MKPRADFQQAPDAAIKLYATTRRLRNARDDFKQRGLARAVTTNDGDDLAALNLEANVLERPDAPRSAAFASRPVERRAQLANERFAQSRISDLLRPDSILLTNILYTNHKYRWPLNNICKLFLHAPERIGGVDQDDQRNDERRGERQPVEWPAEQRGAKAVNDARERIKAEQPLPLLRH